jgi:alkylation response protein AidB-like acyl-CoA dehydrogenase
MDLTLTPDQELIRDGAERFAAQDYSFAHRRAIRNGPDGIDAAAWAHYARMGWLAIGVPERFGGLDGPYADQLVLHHALAGAMLLEPLVSTAVWAVELIKRTATEAQQAAHLEPIVAGGTRWACALLEPRGRFELAAVATEATPDGGGWIICGAKHAALHLPLADRILVSARAGGALRLFVLPAAAPGLVIHKFETVDGGAAGHLTLNEVRVDGDAALGSGADALPTIEAAADLATAALCAEGWGTLQRLLAITTEYLRTRRQFGEPIGRFQALQHRLSDMYLAEQRCASAVAMLRYGLDGAAERERQRLVSAAKVQIDKSGRYVAQQAIQLHGGIGVTDEYVVGHYCKRLMAIAAQCGDEAFHLDRLARLRDPPADC